MKLSRTTAIASAFLAVILSAPAFAVSPDAHSALPGTVNYVEGEASIGSDTLNGNSVGSTTLEPGQTLETGNGKAEILLTPGVFLRVDSNSAIQMVSPGLTNTEVRLDRGRAMVEVAEIHDQNNLRVREDGVETRLMKKGLYEFDAGANQVLVFDGKAHVELGDKEIGVSGGHALDFNAEKPKPQGFDKDAAKQSDLYQWSSLRSSYLAEANVNTASVYLADGYYGPNWFGPGWYWAPGFGGYTWIPGNGILYSPFGWGFYSPMVVYRAPHIWGYDRPWRYGYERPGQIVTVGPPTGTYAGRPVITPRAITPRAPIARPAPSFHSSPGFHGGFGAAHMGGVHR